MFKKRFIGLAVAGLVCALCTTSAACSKKTQVEEVVDMKHTINLCTGDSYDFGAMGYTVESVSGSLKKDGNIVTADVKGSGIVKVALADSGEKETFKVAAYNTSAELGAKYFVNKGMFKNKKLVIFGASTADGWTCEPGQKADGDYEHMAFTYLCRELEMASDPTDILNCNFACGGTTFIDTGGYYGLSGIQRVLSTSIINENGVQHPVTDRRNIVDNLPNADFCLIWYGGNDFASGIKAYADDGFTDYPKAIVDVTSIKGGMYFMINALRERNPKLKILAVGLPFRRANNKNNTIYINDKTDIFNKNSDTSVKEVNSALSAVCAEMGVKFVDWFPVFNYEMIGNSSTYTSDGLHPNRLGQHMLYEFLSAELKKEYN